MFRTQRPAHRAAAIALAALTVVGQRMTRAADVTWDNGSLNFLWDTTSPNWTGAAWNNAAGDGAVFGATGVGGITVPGPVSVDSLNFLVNGYKLLGPGPINFVSGISTWTTGVVNVEGASTAEILSPINSAVGFQKIGAGVLEISGAGSYTGAIPVTANGVLRADVLVGGTTGTINGGTLRVMTPAALPASSRVSIGTGYLDIGANNVTIAELIFTNQNVSAPWNPTLNANNGVIGSGGTLRVLGDISVLGVTGNSGGNSIAANLDLGGGTQVVRCGIISQIGLHTALMFTGSISNGSLVKTVGYTAAGTFGSVDGIGLYANNTYTGATVLNSGSSIAAGNNQSSSILVTGLPAGPAGSSFTLLGANGAFPAATRIQASAGASFVIDNNVTLGSTGLIQPTVPAAQNNNRLNDNAAMELRDGNFTYRGFAGAAAGETFGSLTASGGNNVVTITPNGGGSVTLTANGNLSLAPRATLFVNTTGTGNALAGTARVFVNGTLPPADATGILPRVFNSADFLTYNATTGLTPYTGYATDFSTPGANVAVTAATAVPTATINALKRTGSFTLTIGATDTLTVTSGMLLSASGTGTYTGGTIAFGGKPGVLAGGTHFIASALSGSDGLIMTSGTGTLAGNMSDLSGELSVHAATANLNTNTFSGPIRVRSGTLNLNVNQTGAGLGPITLGVPENEVDLIGTVPTLSFSGAGANAVFDRDLIVDNAAETAKGIPLSFSTIARLSPLSNGTGSQTWNGNVELRSSVNLQGGGGTGAIPGATVFTGDITGTGRFVIPNGRVIFSETSSVSNSGGFLLGNAGFTVQVTFAGTASGNGPISFTSGNNPQLRYAAGSLPGGPITFNGALAGAAVTVTPTNSSTIDNTVTLNNPVIVDTPVGVNAEWTGMVSGASALTKSGPGTLVLSNVASLYSGEVTANAGLFKVNGALPASAVGVNFDATLAGDGAIDGIATINSGGTIAPGGSLGSLAVGGLNLAGSFAVEIDLGAPAADLLETNGAVTLVGGTLDLSVLNVPTTPYAGQTYLLLANDGTDAIGGSFAAVNGVPAGFTFAIDYSFAGVDVLGRLGTGNDVALTLIPEPATGLMLTGLAGAALFRRRR